MWAQTNLEHFVYCRITAFMFVTSRKRAIKLQELLLKLYTITHSLSNGKCIENTLFQLINFQACQNYHLILIIPSSTLLMHHYEFDVSSAQLKYMQNIKIIFSYNLLK